MKRLIINILLWTWCFPQTFLGAIVKTFTRLEFLGEVNGASFWITSIKSGSVSLGKYILIDKYNKNHEYIINHEFGHYKQNLMLGWLYLFVIGIPSFIWANFFYNYRKKHNISYWSFYTEKWANKLGGNV